MVCVYVLLHALYLCVLWGVIGVCVRVCVGMSECMLLRGCVWHVCVCVHARTCVMICVCVGVLVHVCVLVCSACVCVCVSAYLPFIAGISNYETLMACFHRAVRLGLV